MNSPLALLSFTGIFGIATIFSIIQQDIKRDRDIEDIRTKWKHGDEMINLKFKIKT